MSFTLDDLESACAQYESKFHNGRPCHGVRNMLFALMGGRKKLSTKRRVDKLASPAEDTATVKLPRTQEDDTTNANDTTNEDELVDESQAAQAYDDLANAMLTMRHKTPQDVQASFGKDQLDEDKDKDQPSQQNEQVEQDDLTQYIDSVRRINDPAPRLEAYLSRVFLYYRLMHKLKFIRSNKVVEPWSAMPWHCDAWIMVLMDFCDFFMRSNEASLLKTNPLTMVKYFFQIRQVIANYDLLQNNKYAFLDAAQAKAWMILLSQAQSKTPKLQ